MSTKHSIWPKKQPIKKLTNRTTSSSPINDTHPIRIAFLGGAKTGKTTLVTNIATNRIPDTYYPTTRVTPILFTYQPSDISTKILLGSKKYNSEPISFPTMLSIPKNPYYRADKHSGKVSPIAVEIIDTPAYNPHSTVPFLEQSIHVDLGPEYLHNLATHFPRKPVSTCPLLVASGASEMNGDVDGYILFYDAVPTYCPPKYGEDIIAPGDDDTGLDSRHSFSLLKPILEGLEDAWKSYLEYKAGWIKGKEKDVYDFKVALKSIWKQENENFNEKDVTIGPPPIWIVCTKVDHPLASPKLVEMGQKLSREWNCGFLALDLNESDVPLALIIRHIIERRYR
ncbi:uncharacterized protein J8A68_001455 [[Candida] subhashii]|uniref:Uncharacterized protein n=1 Tax=[Candida] subhashii TaxID=561895 RepID=A0A8J5R3C8_9ASCO|nr:uncharacterized protein J8A68_001455 [[Candida] subhashii]KAG7664990.1 hypothetical protein J8A68_001455 [[Candida] subhashii]